MRAPVATISFWVGGLQSLLHPAEIGKNQYHWGENIICRGGIIQTRPGKRLMLSIAGTIAQGVCVFRPRDSMWRLVIAVDGKVYQGKWPHFELAQIEGIEFNPKVSNVYFCSTLQSAERQLDGSIKKIDPTPLLVLQDGTSPAAFWDGSRGVHADVGAPKYETPTGTWMAWSGSRLWLLDGSRVLSSDIGNARNFTEGTYLSTQDGFELPEEGTGIIEAANNAGLLVFTRKTTTALKSFIHQRNLWQNTDEFQKVVFPGLGCIGGRSAINQYGKTSWFSDKGWTDLDAAQFSQVSSKMITLDNAMMRAKRNLSPIQDGICAASFENLALVSVPVGGKWNEQTWVMDQAPLGDAKESPAGVWASIWTGIRPVQYASAEFGGRDRLYSLGYDKSSKDDTRIHLWEEIQGDRLDAEGPISCQWQTAVVAAEEFVRFKYAEIEFVEILGDVSVQVYVYATKGPFFQVAEFRFFAEIGSLKANETLGLLSTLQAFKPQARSERTQEFNLRGKECHPEFSGKTVDTDKGFGLLFVWRGQCGVREIKFVYDQAQQSKQGACTPPENAETFNAVNERGESVAEPAIIVENEEGGGGGDT